MKPIYPSFKGLIMCGYQGWFRGEGDGSESGWGNYGNEGIFNSDNVTIDIWPDVSEYEKTYETEFTNSDGTKAKVFSSYDESTSDLHFKWLKDYGIDGLFIQRFYDATKGKENSKNLDTILANALKASQKYEKAIAVMYDLSGLQADGDDCQTIVEDWKRLVDELKILNFGNKQTYLHHNEKPLVAIWGVGFKDRPYDPKKIGLAELINFLKNDPHYGGCSVMLGVPTHFRTLEKDTTSDPYLHELIESADIILPWMVKRFSPFTQNAMEFIQDQVMADIKWSKERGVDYVPSVYPGFSWKNLSRQREGLDRTAIYGSIPRLSGQFYWDQLVTMINSGAEMIYGAMFDEVDEGTAIFKISDTPPNNGRIKFVDNDGMPSDHYLWLTGEANKMLNNEIPVSKDMPERSK
jgi:hypothetical protein